jgi:hypothetical protein
MSLCVTRVVAALADPDADGTGKDVAAVADDVVVHRDPAVRSASLAAMPVSPIRTPPRRSRAAANRRSVQSKQPLRNQTAYVPTWPISQSDDRHVPSPVGHHHGLDRRGGLRRFESAGRRQPLGVLERQPLIVTCSTKFARRRVSLDAMNRSMTGATTEPWPCPAGQRICSTASRRGPGTIRPARPRPRGSSPSDSASSAATGSRASCLRRW